MDSGESSYNRFLMGDENALEELIAHYRKPLTYFIYGFVKDFDAAEDIIIDTFVELVRSKGQFNGDSSLKTYLFKIGRNKSLRYIKQRKCRDFVPIEDVDNYISDDYSLEDEILHDQRKITVRNAIKTLTPDYREVIYLLYFEDMTYENAAVVLGKSKKYISNAAYRAKLSLKNILEREGFIYNEQL